MLKIEELNMDYCVLLDWTSDALTEAFNDRSPRVKTPDNYTNDQLDLTRSQYARTSDTYVAPVHDNFTKDVTKHLNLPYDPDTLWFHGTAKNTPELHPPQNFKKASGATMHNYLERNTLLGPHFANNAHTAFRHFTRLGKWGTGWVEGNRPNDTGSIVVAQLAGKIHPYGNEQELDDEFKDHVRTTIQKAGLGMPSAHKDMGDIMNEYGTEFGSGHNLLRAGAASFRKMHTQRGTIPVYRNEAEPGEAAIVPHYGSLNWRHTISPDQMHAIGKIHDEHFPPPMRPPKQSPPQKSYTMPPTTDFYNPMNLPIKKD